jgi:hypothetical protein
MMEPQENYNLKKEASISTNIFLGSYYAHP